MAEPLTEQMIDNLFKSIYAVVMGADGPWQEKKAKILEQAGDNTTCLEEFIAWFDDLGEETK
jgi:hypothetical protein